MGIQRSLIMLFVSTFFCSVTACPDGFVPWHEGYCCSMLIGMGGWITSPMNWLDSINVCRDHGGELGSIHSELENRRIAAIMKETGQATLWLGLQCMLTSVWTDHTLVNYRNGRNNCICCFTDNEHVFSIDSDGAWNPLKWASVKMNPLCRHRRRNDERCSDYDEVEGTCISIRTSPQTWWLAENQCQQEGGHLLSIHDQKMNDYIAKHISNPEVVGKSGAFLIGLQSQASPKGETLNWSDGSDVNYTNFAPGFPTDALGQCTAMQTSPGGKWQSTHCEESSLPYICTRPVNNAIQAADCPNNPNFKDSGTVMSPLYPSSSGPLNNCQYFLTVPQGKKVQLVINDFNTNLCCDKLMLYDGLTATTPFATLSGKAAQTIYTTPTSNTLKMIYSSTDGTFVRGWKVTFSGV